MNQFRVILLLLLSLLALPSLAEERHVDRRGRFEVLVPTGWTVSLSESRVEPLAMHKGDEATVYVAIPDLEWISQMAQAEAEMKVTNRFEGSLGGEPSSNSVYKDSEGHEAVLIVSSRHQVPCFFLNVIVKAPLDEAALEKDIARITSSFKMLK